MISATRRWLRRNRTTFAIGAGVVGVGYVAGQYVVSKITEARDRMADERIAKENLRRRFQQNQEDCTITVLELLPTLTDNVTEAQPSERITQELQHKKAERLGRSANISEIAPSEASSTAPSATDRESSLSDSYLHASQATTSSTDDGALKPARTKAQLWSELKISSITRAFTLIYCVALLSLLTRIQLNLLGRKNYFLSIVSQVSSSPQSPTISLENRDDDGMERARGADFETNRKYLTFSWWLLHRGWSAVMTKVQNAVQETFGTVKPTEDITVDRMSQLILDVRRKVEGSTTEERRAHQWLPYLLPPKDQENSVLRESGMAPSPSHSQADPASSELQPPLRLLLNETADLIDSPMFGQVITLLLDTAFSHLTDNKVRSEAFKISSLSAATTERIQDVTENDPTTASAKLATILAVMTREAHKIGNGVPNEYVQALENVGDLEGFAAVIFGSNFDLDPMGNNSLSNLDPSIADSPQADQNANPSADATDILGRAGGVAHAAWGGFESIWSKATGTTGASSGS